MPYIKLQLVSHMLVVRAAAQQLCTHLSSDSADGYERENVLCALVCLHCLCHMIEVSA